MSATHHSEWREFIRRSRHIATHIGFVPEEKGTVCELFVDSGNHRGESLSRSHKIALYVGAGQVAKLKQSYDSRRHEDHTSDDQQRGSYEAHFIEWSGQVIELSDAVSRICQQFDVVLTLRNLSCNMRTESEMRRMVEWISVHLKPGGTWVGSMADSSAIWKLLNKTPVTSLLCRDKNFIIEVKTAEIKHYGTDFEFTAPDGSKTHEYLVHLPSLLRTARGFDLHLLEFTSINDLLAEHSKALGLSTIEPSHPCWTALSLFGVFAFEKLEA